MDNIDIYMNKLIKYNLVKKIFNCEYEKYINKCIDIELSPIPSSYLVKIENEFN